MNLRTWHGLGLSRAHAILQVVLGITLALGLSLLPEGAQAQRRPRGVPVNVESVPPGATVYLDTTEGVPPLGTTPLSSVRIPAGAHTLIFRLPNHEEARLSITVRRRRETFRAMLRGLATIEVSAGNEGARGAEVRIDGQPVGGGTLGSLPIRVENLAPGRHQVQVNREGYNNFEQWVDVQGGQVVRVTAMLERQAPTVGSILVAADIQGAPIFLDGQPRGATTTVIDDVPAGMHNLEIRPEGEDTQPFSQQIMVIAGQRATVNATLRRPQTAPTTGTIAVITDAPDPQVRINGQPLPAGSLSRDGLAPGNYVVQVLAEGYQPFRREVTVTAGQTTTVDAQLQRELGPPGRINIVVSNVSGARVIVDGEERSSPYVVNQPPPGTHAVVVRAPGYEEISFTCNTAPGTPAADGCERTLELQPLAVPIRVSLLNEIEGTATLSIDGNVVSQVPYEGRIPVGEHTIEVTAEGYESFRQQMVVEYGEGDIRIEANLRDSTEEAAAEGTTHSALPIVVNHPMIDLSAGWPYLAEIRLNVGLHELFDAGIAIRTFGRLTDFEGRVRFGARALRQIALGVQARFGGGIGPNISVAAPSAMNEPGFNSPAAEPANGVFTVPVNSAFFSVDAMISLMLEPIASVSLWAGYDFTSDEYYSHEFREGVFTGTACRSTPGMGSTPAILDCFDQRQDLSAFRIGGAVEFIVGSAFNIWFQFEGVPYREQTRRILNGFWRDLYVPEIYPRAGVTFKF